AWSRGTNASVRSHETNLPFYATGRIPFPAFRVVRGEAQRQPAEAAQEETPGPFDGVALRQAEIPEARDDRREGDTRLQPRQRGAEAEVDAVAKTDVRVRIAVD